MKTSRFVAAATVLCATPAVADLTAEEVLADHLNLLSGYGLLEVSTTGMRETPDGLTVDGFTLTLVEDDSEGEILLGGMELTELADGSVRIDYPEDFPITIGPDRDLEEPVTLFLTFELAGMSHVVSGDDGELEHEIDFEAISLSEIAADPSDTLDEFETEGIFALEGGQATINFSDDPASRSVAVTLEKLESAFKGTIPTEVDLGVNSSTTEYEGPGNVDMAMTLGDLGAVVGFIDSDVPRHTLDLSIGDMEWRQDMDIPDEGDIAFDLGGEDFRLNYDVSLSIEDFENDFPGAIAAGQYARGEASAGRFGYTFEGDLPEGPMAGSTSTDGSDVRLSLDKTGIRYEGTAGLTEALISVPAIPDMPFTEIGYTVAETAMELIFPLLPSDEPQDFRLFLSVLGLETEEDIWNLFDPAAQIPRDAIDLVIDLEGSALLTQDPFDPETDVPLSEAEARLNDFRLRIAGAELTGNGEISGTAAGDMPQGEGRLEMALTGANTLLDTLVAMGLVPDDQAMGARMMLSLFARPGNGPDTLVSTIELNADGSIIANGQRIK